MNTVKNFTTIHLQLNSIELLEFAILLSNKVCVLNKLKKKKHLNLSVFNMITGVNEAKTLTKHLSCKCKCRFDRRKCNSDQ